MNRGLIRSDSADLSKTIFLWPKQRLLFALMPDDVFASIWEMFNFIVWSDHIWRSRRHEGKKQLNILPGMRIFLPTTAIFCCDHWVQDDPDLLNQAQNTSVQGSDRAQGRAAGQNEPKCFYIAEASNRAVGISIYMGRAWSLWGCAHKYQPAFRSLLYLAASSSEHAKIDRSFPYIPLSHCETSTAVKCPIPIL